MACFCVYVYMCVRAHVPCHWYGVKRTTLGVGFPFCHVNSKDWTLSRMAISIFICLVFCLSSESHPKYLTVHVILFVWLYHVFQCSIWTEEESPKFEVKGCCESPKLAARIKTLWKRKWNQLSRPQLNFIVILETCCIL